MKDSSGFSLIEILVAMVLLVAVSGLAFSAFSSSAKVQQTPNNVAANVSRGIIEQLREFVRANPVAGNPLAVGAYSTGSGLATSISLNGTTFSPTYNVVSVDINGDGIEDYRKVDTRVQW